MNIPKSEIENEHFKLESSIGFFPTESMCRNNVKVLNTPWISHFSNNDTHHFLHSLLLPSKTTETD